MRTGFIVSLVVGLGACAPSAGEPADLVSGASDLAGLPASSTDLAGATPLGCSGHLPDPTLTPGALCSATDPNFGGFRYAEQIPVCVRNVPTQERDAIGASYGIAPANFPNYEFDHYIPLSIGGSDDQKNLWPQPHVEALDKDLLEQKVFDGMNAGTMTQAQAIAMIRAWRPPGISCP